ncbi:hypothetical protein HO133_003308 [Letharia lupina]|uniref:MYND-type domain-containing protein n=1 Tax=Letharia lupina TaxID=560253 RepID=A0A8H6F9F0_9LECA|nr:uncharacterized protein HO133_003308 [Letharia lupina]KAF6220177.1 hypothetical protein HO133_003308 [Letharia lupina]
MATLPKHIYTQITPDAGTGLFASEAIPPGVEILRIERPLVSVLDSPHLKDTCSECSLWLPQNDDDRDPKCKRLKACQACKVTKYCCKECQTQSWKKHHKYECKIFAKLYPNVLPNTVRIVMQLLLRLNAKSLPDPEWQAFLDLQSHVDEIRSSQIKNEDGLTTWHAIELMSQAASSYSGSQEPISFIQTLTARILINSHTLTTPNLDPLGITNGLPDPRPDHNFDAVQARAVGLQAEASTLPQDRAAALLKSALGFLGHYPPHRQPSPSILHTAFLNAIATQSWAIALSYALKAYFLIDPLHYRSSWHPVRVVRKWVLLRLVTQIAGIVSEGDGSIKGLEKFGINWQIVAVGLFHEISDGAPHSHGSNSPFTAEVKAFGEGAGMGRGKCEKALLEEEWAKLRKVADG